MRQTSCILSVAMIAMFSGGACAQTTQSSGVGTLRGKVSVKTTALFQKPDLSRVVVYLASNPALDRKTGPAINAVVTQYNKTFAPNFLVVPTGTNVDFPNWDDFDHNVFSKSAAAPAFDLERYPKGQSKARVFEKLGVVQVFCNIHPDMRAVIYVTPNGFFTTASKDGAFKIDGIPAGSYEIVAWQERSEEQRQTVQIAADRAADVTFSLQEQRDRALTSGSDARGGYGVERGLGVKREQLDLPVVTDVHPAPAGSHP